MTHEEDAIQALMNQFTTAFNAGDIDAVMKCYLPGNNFVIYDIVPRSEYRGADHYREYFLEMFTHFTGQPNIAISQLGVTAKGDSGFGHCFMTVTGTDTQGQPVNRTVRVTDGYLKVDGQWLIAQEHISVPVDLSDLHERPL
jgi:uncharacterized protein (TIGR02246 family)